MAAWLWPPGILPASICRESNPCSLPGDGDGDVDGAFTVPEAELPAPLSAAPLLLVFSGSFILEL